MNEMVSPKLTSCGNQHKEAQKSPAHHKVWKRDLADPSTRSPTEAYSMFRYSELERERQRI